MDSTEVITELTNTIINMDIANLILSIITILFSIPTFILVIIGIIRKRQLISVRIDGCSVREYDNHYELYINIDNRLDHIISITKIEINNLPCLIIENDKYTDVNFTIKAYLSKKVKILVPNFKPEEKIKIRVFTSYREKPYSDSKSSIISLLNTKNKEKK